MCPFPVTADTANTGLYLFTCTGFLQGSSIVKFPDFSLSFQVVEWQFPRPYQNNNPVAQMLEMAHYIPKVYNNYEKHVIYRAILSAARASGGAL